MTEPLKIMVIPDCQVRDGIPLDHLTWAGMAIVDYEPDVIVNIGDFADMPSLSTYEKAGSKYFEGKRYHTDIEVAKNGMAMLLAPLRAEQERLIRNKKANYTPRMVLTLGNHENRIDRAIKAEPILEGTISINDLGYDKDWEVYGFLKPVFINGVGFSHYWPVGVMGRPAAMAVSIINKLHMSCVAGHQQGKQVAYGKRADGSSLCAIIAGSFYQHDEEYMDQLSNRHWRGIVILNEVIDGRFDEMFLSIDYLKRRYNK